MPMKSKQTSTPSKNANPYAKQKPPESAAELFERGRKLIEGNSLTERSRQVLPQSIDLMADAVSEMLTTGTSEQVLDNLLRAAIEHISQRTFKRGIGIDDQGEIRDYVDGEIKHLLQPWKQDVISQWRHNRRETPAAVDPRTITELIRQNARDTLEDCLEEFLGTATPEEIRFLTDVMHNYESAHPVSPTIAGSEMALGVAFQWALKAPNCYMAVPERMVAKVEKYIAALRAVDDKAVA